MRLTMNLAFFAVAGLNLAACGVESSAPKNPFNSGDAHVVDPIERTYNLVAALHSSDSCDAMALSPLEVDYQGFELRGEPGFFGMGRTISFYRCDAAGACSDAAVDKWQFYGKEGNVWQGAEVTTSWGEYDDGEMTCTLQQSTTQAERDGDEVTLSYVVLRAEGLPPIDGSCFGDNRISQLLEAHGDKLSCTDLEVVVGQAMQ